MDYESVELSKLFGSAQLKTGARDILQKMFVSTLKLLFTCCI